MPSIYGTPFTEVQSAFWTQNDQSPFGSFGPSPDYIVSLLSVPLTCAGWEQIAWGSDGLTGGDQLRIGLFGASSAGNFPIVADALSSYPSSGEASVTAYFQNEEAPAFSGTISVFISDQNALGTFYVGFGTDNFLEGTFSATQCPWVPSGDAGAVVDGGSD